MSDADSKVPALAPETMTKSKLIEVLAQKMNLTKSRAETIVNCIFDTMAHSLYRRDSIQIRGFGTFQVKDYGGYVGKNPRDRKPVDVTPKSQPKFKVGKELQELVMGGVQPGTSPIGE